MRILSVSLDKRVLDPRSDVAKRQGEYYRGHEVEYIVLDGSAKFSSFLSAWKRARAARGFDVVTAQDPLACGWIGLVASRASRCGFHVQDHSGQTSSPFAQSILKRADRIRTVSQRGKKNLLALGIPEDKIDVIPIATDVTRFAVVQRKPEKIILCIARLEEEKGVDVLLHAFEHLVDQYPDYSLTIVGDGSERAWLEELAPEGVAFVGAQSDVRPYLERAAIYVQPSHFEGWGMAVVEAAAAGVPIVMSDVGLAGEIIKDGESGLIVPPGDAHGLAEAFERLMSDASLAQKLSAGAKKAVQSLPTPERSVDLVRASLAAAYHKPRVLLITQAIDRDDPVLGFFHHWVEKFCEQADVRVICLRKGSYDLPCEVISLGKETGAGKIKRFTNFVSALWRLQHEYDSVFVHMNDVYVVLAGWWWRVTGKRIGLWRNHPQGTWMTPIAVAFSHTVFCTSPHAFTARYKKTTRMPAGIDTDLFRSDIGNRIAKSILFFGRLSRIKHPEVFLRALGRMKDQAWTARIVGDPLAQDGNFAEELHQLTADLGIRDRVSFEPSISNDEAPALFASSAIYVNATPTGSYDKTVIEAMAAGCLVAVGNRNFDGEIDSKFIWREGDDASLAQTLSILLNTSQREGDGLREYAEKTHGLDALIRQLLIKLR